MDAAMAATERFLALAEVQLRASDPKHSAWLSASAGTGKTQVLTARVLRLLLAGVEPGAILCLTFTKAGAAEMAQRIHARLAQWVRLKNEDLARDLLALGEDISPDAVSRARTLFARVLDAPGGGLRIETIHAFAQSLLSTFPIEAGIAPGFRPLEGRDETLLRHNVLADLLVRAEAEGDLGLIDDVQQLSLRLGEEGTRSLLFQASRAPDELAALGPREAIEPRLRRELGLPLGDIDEAVAEACGNIDCALLERIADANRRWSTSTGAGRAERIAIWLAADSTGRAETIGDLHGLFWTQTGDPRKVEKGLEAAEEEYAAMAAAVRERCAAALALRRASEVASLIAAAWRAGQSYALAYREAKRATGVVDFDDMIRGVDELLRQPGIGDWVRFKLDRAIDHVLVDEAQDTNPRQWAIVASLASEFFVGEGAVTANRTIFTVGDFKQAIFGFQGTSPIAFEAARLRFAIAAEMGGKPIADLTLDQSYRSTPPILAVVDGLIGRLGADALGLPDPPSGHRSARGELPGSVLLWAPVSAVGDDEIDDSEENWIDDATRRFADRLARQVRAWLDEPLWLGARGRPVRPEDILILVRRRGELAGLIVARLHAEGVPVAGVDRLRLAAPLAVRDLLAAIRFALQPEDDLTLAALLVSPLLGWSQDALYDLAHDRGGIGLWRALRQRPEPVPELLSTLLAMADFATPYQLLETILSGPFDGRRRLLERLGEEARDPIEELLNTALAFEDNDLPSLQGFLEWLERDDFEIARDPSAPHDAVRVMTVHGAKGLQAPLVILADAAFDPDKTPARAVALELEEVGHVPIFRPRKDERIALLDDAVRLAEKRDREEHWRLLYVAATRAEEMLVIGGALGPAMRGAPPTESWYAVLDGVLTDLGTDWDEDPLWSRVRHYRSGVATKSARTETPPAAAIALPDWIRQRAPREARPPRPLAPSAIGPDDVADPPPGPALREAARRGTLLHALFERLPSVAPERRTVAAARWLEAQGVDDAMARDEIVAAACGIIAEPALAALFTPAALAEAPIAAVVDGVVVAGTVDRLVVEDERVRLVDFKTGRRVPATVDAAPEHHLRQMGAYAAALGVIFPGRAIEASLLYTAGPKLLRCPPDLLARYKPRLPEVE
jgi:ATP-dependent helicase/nuclease subunit A